MLKTNDHLLSVGLHDGEIPPEEGVRRFVEAFVSDPGHAAPVHLRPVGWLRALGSITPDGQRSVGLRFVEQVSHLEPDVEIIARCRLQTRSRPLSSRPRLQRPVHRADGASAGDPGASRRCALAR